MGSHWLDDLTARIESLDARITVLEKAFGVASTHQKTALQTIAQRANVDLISVLGRGRTQQVRRARAAMVHYLRRQGLSFPEIGRQLGGRHHTTVWQIERNTIADPGVFALLRGAL